jgi:hypothetical protein
LLLGMPAGLARAHAPVTAPYCGLHWGSGFKTGGTYYSVPGEGVSNVRAGRHACFDRLVVDLNGPNDFYDVSYVPGTPVPLRAGATLDIAVGASAQDANRQPNCRPANPTATLSMSAVGARSVRSPWGRPWTTGERSQWERARGFRCGCSCSTGPGARGGWSSTSPTVGDRRVDRPPARMGTG